MPTGDVDVVELSGLDGIDNGLRRQAEGLGGLPQGQPAWGRVGSGDENHAPLRENLERLEGEKVEVIPLPMPSPMFFCGQRLPARTAW